MAEKRKPTEKEVQEIKKTWGTWQKEPSKFDWYYDSKEVCLVLEGKVKVTWDGGEITFGKGDLVTFPQGLQCVWEVQETIKKHFNFE